MGQTLARLLVDAGHRVRLANSRGPESLRPLIAELGPCAVAGTSEEIVAFADVVVLATRWAHTPAGVKGLGPWNGKVVIDTTNNRTGPRPEDLIDLGDRTSSEVVADLLPGARVDKAFNHQPISALAESLGASPSERNALFIAGDDVDAKHLVARLIRDIGGEPIDPRSLRDGGRLQGTGGPLAGHGRLLTLAEARRLIDGQAAAARSSFMEMLRLSIRILVALALLSWASGYAIPYSRDFKPKWDTVIGNEAATKFHRLKLSTKLLDATTREEIRDTKAIIIIWRSKYSSAADLASSAPRRPRVEVESFSDLDSVTYSQRGLHLVPFYDYAAEYTGASIYIYRNGYDAVPYGVAFRPVGDEQVQREIDALPADFERPREIQRYPYVIELNRSDAQSNLMKLLNMVTQGIENEEWKLYVRNTILDKLK